MATNHNHVMIPTRTNVYNDATADMKKTGPKEWRCFSVEGDPATVIHYCRCGSHRRGSAVLGADLKPVLVAPMEAWS